MLDSPKIAGVSGDATVMASETQCLRLFEVLEGYFLASGCFHVFINIG